MRRLAEQDVFLVKTFGHFTLLGAAGFISLFFANLHSRLRYGAPDWSWLGYFGLYALIVGVGLIRLQGWAVVLFSAPISLFGVMLTAFVLRHQPTIFSTMLAIAWGVLLNLSGVSVARAWWRLKQRTSLRAS